jgi:hypothetical protein
MRSHNYSFMSLYRPLCILHIKTNVSGSSLVCATSFCAAGNYNKILCMLRRLSEVDPMSYYG